MNGCSFVSANLFLKKGECYKNVLFSCGVSQEVLTKIGLKSKLKFPDVDSEL